MKKLSLFIFLCAFISFSYASSPPSFITITSPQDGSYLGNTVAIETELTQIPQVRSVKFYIDNQLVGEDTTQPYQYTWDTTTYSDGQHTIYASALQAQERPDLPEQQPGLPLDSPKITVTVDNTPPNISITSPQDNSFTTGTITTEANVTDNLGISKVEFKIDDTLLKEFTSSPYTYQFDTAQTQDGAHTFTVTAYDLANNKTEVIVNFTIDNSPPTQPQITDDGIYTTSLTQLHAIFTSEDPHSGIIEYLYSIGTEKGKSDILDWISSGTNTEITLDNLTLTQGTTYFINVKSKNKLGLFSQTGSSDGIIANDGETLLINITSPQNGSLVNTPTITVEGTVSRNDALVTVNGITALVSDNTFIALNIPLEELTNIIIARATKDTQTAEDTIDVILDQDPPSINILVPDNNSTTRSNIVYGRVSDDAQSVTVNGVQAELLENNYFLARAALTEGPNTIVVQATDKVGNTGQSSVNVIYNTQSPKVTITSPQDNSEINISPIKVEGTNTQDIKFIIVESQAALINNTNFYAEGIPLDSSKSIITATGYDSNNNRFLDSILINSPQLANYELTKVSGDVTEDDPNRPKAGSNHTLIVKLEKNNLPAPNEEIQFRATQGQGTLSQTSVFTDINGEATTTLTLDTNSDITNQVECFPTSNILLKAIFNIDTKPGLPSILTKITDDSITPVPGATIPLIVKLTDQYNNLIPDETINFQVTQGAGILSSPTVTTNYYGEAKVNLVCPNIGLVLTQIKASSQTVPSVTTTFNIITSAPLTITVDDIINKVNYNDSKIQDIKADITVTSNAPFLPPQMQLKIWQKGEKQKVQELSPNPQINIRPPLQTSTEYVGIQREIISYDPTNNIYVIKTKQSGQTEEYPYQILYIDYNKGVELKSEYYTKDSQLEMIFVTEAEDFVQIQDAWVFQKLIETAYEGQGRKELYHTENVYNNIQINTSILDSEFQ